MIDKEEFEKASFEENQKFIKKILKLATHNAFTKDDLLLLIKWQNEIIEKMVCCMNCGNQRNMCLPKSKKLYCSNWRLAECGK